MATSPRGPFLKAAPSLCSASSGPRAVSFNRASNPGSRLSVSLGTLKVPPGKAGRAGGSTPPPLLCRHAGCPQPPESGGIPPRVISQGRRAQAAWHMVSAIFLVISGGRVSGAAEKHEESVGWSVPVSCTLGRNPIALCRWAHNSFFNWLL